MSGNGNLYDHDKTQVLSRIGHAISEGERDLNQHREPEVISDDGTSIRLTAIPARYSANISFRRVDGEGWSDERGYTADVSGSSHFVSDVLSAACGAFIDSEER